MAGYYTIGQYQYTVCFGEGESSTDASCLHLKAIHYQSLTDYRCDIMIDDIKAYRLIDSLESLHDILIDGFNTTNKEVVDLNITYHKIRDEIDFALIIHFPYLKEIFKFKLISVKELANNEIINNKMQYFNKRLTDLENERTTIEGMTIQMDRLRKRLDQLEFNDQVSKDYISICGHGGMYHVCIPIALNLNVSSTNITITNDSQNYTITVRYDDCEIYGLNKHYYHNMLCRLTQLSNIIIDGVNWSTLEYIKNCSEVIELTLSNLTNLVDIKDICKFSKLKTLTITECRKIKNLKILETCKSLELLNAHASMNTGVFSEALSFRIEIV